MEERGQHVCGEADAGRLDTVLARARTELSRARWQEEIKADRVTVNGQPGRCKMRVVPGDVIDWTRPPPTPIETAPENILLDVLYEDEDLIVINKPPNFVVHPAPGHYTGTLVNALLYHCPDLPGIGGELRPGIVHRLDRDTSGVMVVAKNDGALHSLAHQFKDRETKKEYLALAWGVPRAAAGTVHTRIGRSTRDRKKMAAYPLAAPDDEAHGKEAISHYEVVKSFERASLLRLRIETGRTHQIRVHLAHIHHPVVGDATYGGARPELPAPRQMLHAERLSLTHPRTKERMTFVAPLPEDFVSVINQLKSSA